MKYISVFLVGITVSFGSLYAQNQGNDSILNRTVVVENQYNPEIMDAFKMNVLPDIEEPAVTKQHIDYATAVRPFSGEPKVNPSAQIAFRLILNIGSLGT